MTDIVEAMHATLAPLPGPGAPATLRARGVSGGVYRAIRRMTGWIGTGVDQTLVALQPLIDRIDATSGGPARAAVIAALNGLVGDHLAASENPLACAMQFRSATGEALAAEGGPTLLLTHGLCMHEGQWRRRGHDHGEALARELGVRPAYLRYNSGRHVAANGRELARRLEDWVDTARTPVTELAIVGFSLGGLVARSACHYAAEAGLRWPHRLRHLVFLGTPHHGAPLERGGHALERALGFSRYSAPLATLGRLRSAGITDLRHGSVLEERGMHDRFGREAAAPAHVALPAGVACAAIAARSGRHARRVADGVIGDGLVPVASALGHHADARRVLAFPAERQRVLQGLHHLDLLDDARAYAALRDLLSPTNRRRRSS